MLNRLTVAGPLFAALLAAAALRGDEQNNWPVSVRQVDSAGATVTVQYVGPLFFAGQTSAEWAGFRPFYLRSHDGDRATGAFLYPLFTWQKQGDYRHFSFFQLINRPQDRDPAGRETSGLDVWPLYFSSQTGSPETSYRAFLPFGGTLRHRLGRDRISFVLFPLYLQTANEGRQITHVPWPFLRFYDGAGHHGFEFWPLFGHSGRENDYDRQFYLWPLIYKSASHLSEPEPERAFGVLPFYNRDTGPGYIRENFVWPFFGYTHRTIPNTYDERRYFWPFLVQGHGPQFLVNRWAPFYTHSNIKGYDKTWVLWPLWRHATWAEDGVEQEKNQLFFIVYWSLTQRSMTNPAAPPARKTHFWPLFSAWDNGAGHRQVQVLSPFEVFFQDNEPVRQLYTPFFALYRYDRQGPDASRHSLLWNAVTYRRSPANREFHLGPLFSSRTTPVTRRVTVGNGLLAWRRAAAGGRWRFSLFDFHPKPDTKAPEASSP